MMNKKSLWFLTLFSLVLVLSIYYITMPEDLLKASTTSKNNTTEITSSVEELDAISALKVEDDATTQDTLDELQNKLTDANTSTEEKNKVYEEIKTLNTNSGLENTLEEKIKKEYKCEAFTKIEDTTIKVVASGCENSKTTANNIMRLVQKEFDKKMYISVKFET